MEQQTTQTARLMGERSRRRRWQRVVGVLAALVVFCTTYALILPAITMTGAPICGIEEHTHTEACYTVREAQPRLVCTAAQTVHVHTDACRGSDGEWICGQADFLLHTHEESCYGADGSLICPLEEIEAHSHTAACWELRQTLICPLEEDPGHTHGESCYTYHRGALICTQAEAAGHSHTEGCYTTVEETVSHEETVLSCGLEESETHAHGDACYTIRTTEETVQRQVLTCTLEEIDGHTHGDACYAWDAELICTQEERPAGHLHGDACYTTDEVLACPLEEIEAHVHTPDCCGDILDGDGAVVSSFEDAYAEAQAAWTGEGEYVFDAGEWAEYLVCGLPAVEEHQHTDACFVFPAEGETETVLTCGREEHVHTSACYPDGPAHICGLEEHTHEEACYDAEGTLICALEEHVHGESCLAEKTAGAAEAGSTVWVCGMEPHSHDAACYGADGALLCAAPEHIHTRDCLTSEDAERLDAAIARIDALPSPEEIEEMLAAYDEAGDEEGFEACYEEIYHQVIGAYIQYEALGPELYELVPNREKLMDLEWMWSAVTYATTNTVNVTAVNSFNWGSYGGALIVHSDSGTNVANAGMGEKEFKYWYAIRVEYEGNRYVVKEIYTNDGSSKANVYASGNGFILLYHTGTIGGNVAVNVSDTVTLSGDFWKTKHDYTGTVYGTVTFSSAAAQKNYKDNSKQLHKVDAASTRDFIELNLYDYGSGSTKKNINDKFNADKNMPGFQQSGGTSNIESLDKFRGTGYMNFGDIITDDLADGRLVTIDSQNPVGINVVRDTANSPISRYSDVMQKTLGSDGYPALANGTSLGYLFGGESYSKKMNSQSVDGLFQYNEITGAYTFNSRENFAQFNSSNDTFTLYKEIFTPNFIMYPFGNFMPFNDIVHDSKQVSKINEAYFNELYLQANYLYQQGKGDQYAQLAKVLGQFMDYAKRDNWGDNWTAERALQHYFHWGSELPKPDDKENNYKQISLDDLYSLDYDVESDFYFGMEMKMNFMQPKGGLTGKDGQQPMVFYFTGDDDVWVYIDDVLFLDLSGIHRHVGGEIDFVNGEVKYYSLNTKTGDVSTTPYKTVKFSELVNASRLNEKGTFPDYSTHSFNFYYMERGSGSSVCRLNFNFPLLRKNAISVSKELSVDEPDKLDLLGNPDFRFQIYKEGGQDLFIPAGTPYDILDSNRVLVGSGTTDQNGIFTIKAGQTAVFSNIAENAGRYFVRELLDIDAFAQYGTVAVDGSSTTTDSAQQVVVAEDTFKGIDSTIKDMSSGSTVFHFNNEVTFNKLGSLSITKKVTDYKTRAVGQFDFMVTLDGVPLPVGTPYTVSTPYTVGTEEKTVAEEGIITLAADETAVIRNILTGSRFTVTETQASAAGYHVTYSGRPDVDTSGGQAAGVILLDSTVEVIVNNGEKGATVEIPFTKTLEGGDGTEHAYTFLLQQVTDSDGATLSQPAFSREAVVKITTQNSVAATFTIDYPQSALQALPSYYYYRITEKEDPAESGTIFDPAQYVVQITVSQAESGELQAEVTEIRKDGEPLPDDQGGSIAFVNKIAFYELPQTGGDGRAGYIWGGLGLMAGSLLLYMIIQRRGKGGTDPA